MSSFTAPSAHIRGIYASASLKLFVLHSNPESRNDIRGIYASASLKRWNQLTSVTIPASYPRHLRLGLIEALSHYQPTTGWSDIRGIYASASLKHPPEEVPILPLAEYPRHLRLGLIEASNGLQSAVSWF